MILFDFDGVLVNSIREVAITSFNAATNSNCRSFEQLDPTYRALFLNNRFHAQPAADFIPLALWCDKQSNANASDQLLLSSMEFKELLANSQLSVDERRERFFGARQIFINQDREGWLQTHTVFCPPWSALQAGAATPLVFLTNKNRSAVLELCEHFELPITGDAIFSGDGGVGKMENLVKIRSQFPDNRYLFIDDSVKNLMDLKAKLPPSGDVELYLASWGYVGPDDVEQAIRGGLNVVSQEQCLDWIKTAS